MRHSGHLEMAQRHSAGRNIVPIFFVLLLVICLTGLTAACGGAAQGSSMAPGGQTTANGYLRVSVPPAQATVGEAYNAVSTVAGGNAPYAFVITNGSLPPGLVLNPETGSISGTPSVAGTYNFALEAWALSGKEHGSSPALIFVSANHSGTELSISPGTANVPSLAQQQFTARFSGTANTAVTWSASAGTISSGGLFTAPKVSSDTSVMVTATTVGSTSSHASAAVTVTAEAPLAITPSALAGADASVLYTASLSASGGVAPYQWSLATGALPSGIQLQASSGVITGTTALAGSYPFTAKVTDSSGHSATLVLTRV